MNRRNRYKRSGRTAAPVLLFAVTTTACGSATDDALSEVGSSTEPVSAHLDDIAAVVTQTNVVTDEGNAAPAIDPSLKNPWGLTFPANGRPWVADNGAGVATVYDPANGARVLQVSIPPPRDGAPPSRPTGVVANANAAAFMGDRFIFVTEDGTVSGWPGGTSAALRFDDPQRDAVYKGLALGMSNGQPRLFAADFFNGKVDVFDASYAAVDLPGAFTDPFLPDHYAPFSVLASGERVFVAYAEQQLPEMTDDAPGAGHGFVDVFSTEGRFLQRLISRGALNSPWGLAIATEDFGDLGGSLLVGNFGDGKVNIYDLIPAGPFLRARREGVLGTDSSTPLVIDGLWALVFAPNVGSLSSRQLWFTAGPDDETHGVFGRLEIP